jgi:hypothetical protein
MGGITMLSAKRFFLGTAIVFLLGSAFHFLFEALGRSAYAAPFFAVNESVWEHMKLLSTAALVWMTADYFLAAKGLRPRFFAARAAALPMALLSIPMLFFFLKGALGVENLFTDIGIFLVASALYQYLAMRLEMKCVSCGKRILEGAVILAGIFLLFAVLTFLPPHLPLFMDPTTGLYGIPT